MKADNKEYDACLITMFIHQLQVKYIWPYNQKTGQPVSIDELWKIKDQFVGRVKDESKN